MQRPFGCPEAVERLWDYLDGALDDIDREAIDHHLSFCLRCCGEVAFTRELQHVLRTRTAPALPDDIRRRLTSLIDDLDDLDDVTDGRRSMQ